MASNPDSIVETASKLEAVNSLSASATKAKQLSSKYALPSVVKARIDGNYSLASATAIVSALFAGVMIGMGQIISSVDDLSPGWEIVRILVYGSIIANLASAMCSLWVMGMCSDMPQRAQQLAIADPDSWPAKAAAQEDLTLPSDLFDNDYHLLRAFGMYQSYSTMEYWEIMWLIVGLVSMFSAITVWTWVAQSKVVAGVLLVFVIPALFFALYPIWRLIRETRREVRAAKLASNDSP